MWPKKKKPPISHGPSSANTKVLIAGKSSAFRDAVISELTGRLVNDSIQVRIINIYDLRGISPEKWDAILLVNKCVGWNYQGPVKKFFTSHQDFRKAVVFTTAGNPVRCIPENKPQRKAKVDTYTSASKVDKTGESVDTIYTLLKKVIAPE